MNPSLGLILGASFSVVGVVALLLDEKLQREKKSAMTYVKMVLFHAVLGYVTAALWKYLPTGTLGGGAPTVYSLPNDLLRGPAPF